MFLFENTFLLYFLWVVCGSFVLVLCFFSSKEAHKCSLTTINNFSEIWIKVFFFLGGACHWFWRCSAHGPLWSGIRRLPAEQSVSSGCSCQQGWRRDGAWLQEKETCLEAVHSSAGLLPQHPWFHYFVLNSSCVRLSPSYCGYVLQEGVSVLASAEISCKRID